MYPQITNWSGPIDCICGAPAEANTAIATVTEAGTDITASCCSFTVWQGIVLYRGDDLEPDEVIRRVRARAPEIASADAYLEPWQRRHALWLGAAPAGNAADPADAGLTARSTGEAE